MSFWRGPVTPTAPRIPQAPARRRAFERAGRKQRPLADKEFPIPGDENEELLAEYAAWRKRTYGSLPEFIVWKWLREKKHLLEGRDFYYQHPLLGGRTQLGGFLLDFWFPARMEGWRVMGLRWHLMYTKDRGRDLIARQILEGRGIRILDLWEDDILARTDYTLNLAWQGRELRPRRGL